MNWKKIKSLIILLLICADIFLAVMLMRQSGTDPYAKEAADDASELLLRACISVDSSLLINNTSSMPIYTVSSTDSVGTIAKLFFSGSASEAFAVPGGVALFSDEGELLKICGSSIFYAAEPFETDELAFEPSEVSELDGGAKKLLNELLTPSGAGGENFGLEVIALEKSEDSSVVRVIQTLDGVRIRNHVLTCKTEGNRIVYVDGEWCFLPIKGKSNAHLLDKTNILFIERNDFEITAAEATEKTDSVTTDAEADVNTDAGAVEDEPLSAPTKVVTAIEHCYSSVAKSDGETLYIVPSYSIEWQDGSFSYYDAISGEKVE